MTGTPRSPGAGHLTADFGPAELRHAFGCFPSGVTAVCGIGGGAPQGMAASSFTSVSLDPPLVSVCVALTSTTWPRLRALPRLGVSVLADDHGPVASALAAKGADRFAAVGWEASPDGAVFVHGSALWLDCTIESEVPAGDHHIVLLRIQGLRPYPDVAPMVFHRSAFRRLSA
jgi:flavin reductase (DIM6/NTAB) family NADH-FMN oxidoreductase RutF